MNTSNHNWTEFGIRTRRTSYCRLLSKRKQLRKANYCIGDHRCTNARHVFENNTMCRVQAEIGLGLIELFTHLSQREPSIQIYASHLTIGKEDNSLIHHRPSICGKTIPLGTNTDIQHVITPCRLSSFHTVIIATPRTSLPWRFLKNQYKQVHRTRSGC